MTRKTQKEQARPGCAGTHSEPVFPRPGGKLCPHGAAHRPGRATGGADHLHPGAVPLAVFLPDREPRLFQTGRADPGPQQHGPATIGPPPQDRPHRLAFRKARGGRLSQHGRRHRRRRPACWASTARCTFRTIRSITRNSTLRPATWAFAPGRPAAAKSASAFAGTNGIPKRPASPPCKGPAFFFIPPPSAGIRRKRREHGVNQHSAWETIQRSHAVANGCYVAAVNRVGLEKPDGGAGLEFWGQSFVAAPSGQILAKAARGPGGNFAGRGGLGPGRCDPHPLAFPARPPHRRLRRLDQTLD